MALKESFNELYKAFSELNEVLALANAKSSVLLLESPVDSLDQVTWKPFMTEQEAITYTKDSVYANITFYHGTSAQASEAIVKNGIDINCCKRAGYGQGFYVTTVRFNCDIPKNFLGLALGVASEHFAIQHASPTILEMKLNVKNPARFEDDLGYLIFLRQNGIVFEPMSIECQGRVADSLKSKGYDCVEIINERVFIVFAPKQVAIYKRSRLKMAEHFWMTPILLPFPEDSDGLLTFKKNYSSPPASFPKTLDALEEVKFLGGFTGAKLVRDSATGKLYVMKKGSSPDHIRSESTANRMYEALGVNVPKHELLETPDGPVKLAEYIEGKPLSQLRGTARTKAIALLQKDFATDALLSNWDVIGVTADNIIVGNDGKVYRVDNGGALEFRAQGAKKISQQWNKYPTELWTLPNFFFNASAAEVFGSLKHSELIKQIDAIALQEKKLLAKTPKPLQDAIRGRLSEMKRIAEVSKILLSKEFEEDYVGEFARHSLGIRAALNL